MAPVELWICGRRSACAPVVCTLPIACWRARATRLPKHALWAGTCTLPLFGPCRIGRRPSGEEGGMHRQTVAKLVARGDLSSRGQGTWGSLDRDEVVALGVARREAEDRRHRERVARRPRGRSGQPPERAESGEGEEHHPPGLRIGNPGVCGEQEQP